MCFRTDCLEGCEDVLIRRVIAKTIIVEGVKLRGEQM